MDFAVWVDHFERNVDVGRAPEDRVDRSATCALDARTRAAFARSFQRFALGESGDGAHLLDKAARAGDARYTRALVMLVAEEQRHAALFGRGLDHLGGTPLHRHWSDTAFTTLRRAVGLRTELGLFLVAESVAMGYFTALAASAPDPVLRSIGRRLEHDERDHLRFQVDRLAQAFATRPAPVRCAARAALLAVGVGAAVVLAADHRAALRACGLRPAPFARSAVRHLRRQLDLVMSPGERPLGPSEPVPDLQRSSPGAERVPR